MPPPLPFTELPRNARRVTQQGSTFYVIGDERAPTSYVVSNSAASTGQAD